MDKNLQFVVGMMDGSAVVGSQVTVAFWFLSATT